MGLGLAWVSAALLLALGCGSDTTGDEGAGGAGSSFAGDGDAPSGGGGTPGGGDGDGGGGDVGGDGDGTGGGDGDGDGSGGGGSGDGDGDGPAVVGPGTIVAEPQDDAAYVFDQAQLRTYEIRVANDDLNFLNANPSAEVYVPATFHVDGSSYPIGVRYKGSIGAFLAPCGSSNVDNPGPKVGKCSIKTKFNFNNPGGRFRGLKKLNFHSMNQDPSLMRDRLAYAMFRQFGQAAPRAVHARLFINGELEGLFVVVEQVDGRFTRSRFTEGGEGNLYKEIWPIHDDPQAYIDALESNQDEMPTADKVLAFKDAINAGTPQMEAWLDRQVTLDHIAADRVMIHDDGPLHWWCGPGGQGNNPPPDGNHNYYWYEARTADRLWLIPWDLDNAFNQLGLIHINVDWRATAACVCSGNGGGIYAQKPASCDTMTGRWGADWGADYSRSVDAFIAGPFAKQNVDGLLDAWESQISSAVSQAAGVHGAISHAGWQAELSSLRSLADAARANRGFDY